MKDFWKKGFFYNLALKGLTIGKSLKKIYKLSIMVYFAQVFQGNIK